MNTRIMIVNKNELLFFMLGIPLMNPAYLSQVDYIGDFIDACRVCSFLIVAVLIIFKRKGISLVAIIIIVSQCFIIMNTLYHNAEQAALLQSAKDGFAIISVILFYEYAIKADTKAFVKSQLLCFETVIYANLFTILKYPSGLYKSQSDWTFFTSNNNWFLGYYNRYTNYFLPAIVFAMINVYYGGKKTRAYLLYAAIAVSVVRVWSGGVLMATFFTCIFLFLGKKFPSIFNYKLYWIIQPITLLLILGVKIQNTFRWLIDSVLNKWASLVVRINLWEKVCEYIDMSPLIGYGIETGVEREIKVGMSWAVHAHNQMLEIIYDGGIIYFVLFTLVILICGKKMKRYKNNYIVIVISAAFGGWSVHSIVEPYIVQFLMGLFILGFYCEKLINEKCRII